MSPTRRIRLILPGRSDDSANIVLLLSGQCTEYCVFFRWTRSLEIFHLACVFELRVPELRRAELQQLASINELLWFGTQVTPY